MPYIKSRNVRCVVTDYYGLSEGCFGEGGSRGGFEIGFEIYGLRPPPSLSNAVALRRSSRWTADDN